MTSFVLRYAHASDLACADHLPGCPDCGDLSDPGATHCEGCGQPLTLQAAAEAKARRLASYSRVTTTPKASR